MSTLLEFLAAGIGIVIVVAITIASMNTILTSTRELLGILKMLSGSQNWRPVIP
ncbi:MAG: hypothetical protein M1357_01715 [Candidatus Marsarchaeota archaeon]|nr:hypothetical protein [Candidatus Marsarchaeota archaeon]